MYNDILNKIIILMESGSKTKKIKITSHKEYSADDQSDQVMESFQIMIQCQNEAEQSASLETLINQGFKCRALNS